MKVGQEDELQSFHICGARITGARICQNNTDKKSATSGILTCSCWRNHETRVINVALPLPRLIYGDSDTDIGFPCVLTFDS